MASKSEREFNKDRRLLLSNLPPSTEVEIKEFLAGIKIKDVQLNDKLDSAIISVQNANQIDEAVSKFNGKELKDSTITVKSTSNEKLLCVAHFPLSYTDKQFVDLCKKQGPVKNAYIVQIDKSGECKGYGLVEFDCDLEKIKSIKCEMDWMEVDGQTLHVDFLDESAQSSYQGLRSRCLFVTGMPETFIDITKMRELFGCVTSPVYCQIVAKDEKSLGYGIVEFKMAEEAEKTWLEMKQQKIEGNDVVISFCIPGKSAVVINNRVVWKFADKLKKNSLLPDPIIAKPVIGGHPLYISLIKMNPKLADDFKAVLGKLQQIYISQKIVPAERPGLLGPAPSLPQSPVMNPNMQLGLIVMFAVSVQNAKREPFTGVLAKQLNSLCDWDAGPMPGPKPSILGDPITGQANVILTNLKKQLNEVPLKGDNDEPLPEPTILDEKLQFISKKLITNGHLLSCSQLANLGQLMVTMNQMALPELPSLKPPGAGGLLSTPTLGPPMGKGNSLLGPVPGLTPLMGNNMNEQPMNKGLSLLGDAPNMPSGGKPHSLLGMGPGPSGKKLQQQQQHNQQQQQQQQQTNKAIVQAMGLGIGASGMNNLGQTLLGQISQGLVHQIGQNLMYQLSVNNSGSGGQSGGPPGSGKGLLGDIPSSSGGGPSLGGNMGSGKGKPGASGKSSLLGEPPSQLKNNQGGGGRGGDVPALLDQGSWKSADNRWGSAGSYESGYGGKSGMGGGGSSGGYNDFGGYGDSYRQDMSGGGGGNSSGYSGGYHGGAQGGYGDGDYYNYQQQYIQSESGYWEYASNYGSGTGFGTGSGSGSMSGANYGNMGSGGMGGSSQASGVNFQDGQYGKNANSTGHGLDNGSGGGGRYGGGMDGYGGNMGGGGGYSSYGTMRGDDMGEGGVHFDSYGTSGFGNNYNDGLSSGGMGGSGGNSMGNMGGGMNSMGGGMNSMGSGMNSMGSGMNSMGGGYGSGGGGNSQIGAYSTGMGNNYGSGSTGNSLLGSGGGMGGLMDNMSGGGGSGGGGSGYGSSGMGSLLGSGSNYGGGVGSMGGSGGGHGSNKAGGMSGGGMSGLSGGGRDHGMGGGSSSYFTSASGGSAGSSGLLPAPGGKFNNTSIPGQKRPYSQLMGGGGGGSGGGAIKTETNLGSQDNYHSMSQGGFTGMTGMGNMAGGMGMGGTGGGLYADSYKRSRLY